MKETLKKVADIFKLIFGYGIMIVLFAGGLTFFGYIAALIIGGGVANLIERIFLAHVVDYLKLSFFPPVCNFADYCITAGTICLIVYLLFFSDLLKSKKEKEKAAKAEKHDEA